jgi:hypothetical protein
MDYSRSKLFAIASTIAIVAAVVGTGHSMGRAAGIAGDEDREVSSAESANASEKTGKPVAVVELFTSEGCSSCPPADRNLKRISELASEDRNVIPLSFHVDYWNELGWVDPFSQKEFSERQQEYAVAMKRKGVYTPQMVVNGLYEFNGSNEDVADKAIELALRQIVKHSVEVRIAEPGRDEAKFTVAYQVASVSSDTDDDSDYVLNVAVVTDAESVKVPRGENGGRELSHVWVVKALQTQPLKAGTGTVKVDATLVRKNHARLVAYVQSMSTREITGASAVDL